MNFEVMGLITRKAFGSPSKKQVILMMAMHAGGTDPGNPLAVGLSSKELAALCEMNERTVRRKRSELESLGVLRKASMLVNFYPVRVWKIELPAIERLPDNGEPT